jgi:hypothetical protein
MRLGSIKIACLLVLLLCLSLVAQNGTKSTAQNGQKEKDSNMSTGADQFEDVHKNLFVDPNEKARQVTQFTDQASKAIPGGTAGMEKMPRKNYIDEYIFGRIEKDGIPHAGMSSMRSSCDVCIWTPQECCPSRRQSASS